MTETLLILALALVIDRIVGDPGWFWARLPHPVVLFGRAISFFDRSLNRRRYDGERRRTNGALTIAILLVASLVLGWVLHRLFASIGPVGFVLEALLTAVFIAHKSLADHVSRVAAGLKQGGLAGGRAAVAMIVGRDPETLDEPAVCRAAIESLAENFSDGVVAPAFWYVLFGLPGLLAYKMLNTADSMIGHKTTKYIDFGRASAILDDWANFIPARMSIFLIAAGALVMRGTGAAKNALGTALRDHGLHRSPNSGWPEAAMAGALDIGLAGPRIYSGILVNEPMINGAGRLSAGGEDIRVSVQIFDLAGTALVILALFLAFCV
ncbi:adenosylcobinamide-phosphate synthase CbiB [Pararhizobium sp.]|uniref:adenosylcobinamide-phosphate synthase CbiB n=1 Tax=Pararhizobium sp. TaxID=1977563 RepID=UPI00271F7480|nr:adenosylcobinamide-phosphate synthase CbiB [Pararhizobium sp.]MDO9418678.1 adenosylcobinamide-phosphate synthase CbiB [Pararhizobium sp.]